MSANPIYDIIQDSVIELLEKGIELPPTFRITLDTDQFNSLLEHGLVSTDGKQISNEVSEIAIYCAEHRVVVVCEGFDVDEGQELQ